MFFLNDRLYTQVYTQNRIAIIIKFEYEFEYKIDHSKKNYFFFFK